MVKISTPQTPAQWEAYYALRYEVLRKPWGQPAGSERSTDEEEAIHAWATDEHESTLGVGRLHCLDDYAGQIRYMAVSPAAQGQGVGKQLLVYLEGKAQELGLQEIVLEAREGAVSFYQSNGYVTEVTTYLLFGEIQHYRMRKALS